MYLYEHCITTIVSYFYRQIVTATQTEKNGILKSCVIIFEIKFTFN